MTVFWNRLCALTCREVDEGETGQDMEQQSGLLVQSLSCIQRVRNCSFPQVKFIATTINLASLSNPYLLQPFGLMSICMLNMLIKNTISCHTVCILADEMPF